MKAPNSKGQELTRRITEGPIIRALIFLALPIVGANLLQTAYQLADTFWVGRVGEEAVAAVSLSFPIIFLMVSVAGGFAIAGTILVAQYAGQNNGKGVSESAGQMITLLTAISVGIAVLGYFISEPLLNLMGAEPKVMPGATSYLQLTFLGMPLFFGYFIFQSLMQGVGDTRTPLWIILGTVILNIVLDPIFIFGWGPIAAYGVTGAAIATLIAQGVAAVIGMAIIFSSKFSFPILPKNLLPDWQIIKKMLRLGFPASIEQSTQSLALLVMTFLVASFGTATVAAYGIGGRVLSFVIIPALGFTQATTTIVGQSIGAKKIERAREAGIVAAKISFFLLTAIGFTFSIFADEIAHIFIPEGGEATLQAGEFIRIMAFSFGFMGAQQTLSGAFRGAGNTLAAMMIAILTLWVFRFPLAYILSKHTPLSEEGLWWSIPISNIIAAVAAIVWFRHIDWSKSSVAKKETEVEATLDVEKPSETSKEPLLLSEGKSTKKD